MHDDFTPPGFLTCAQLLELAGKVLLKDEVEVQVLPRPVGLRTIGAGG